MNLSLLAYVIIWEQNTTVIVSKSRFNDLTLYGKLLDKKKTFELGSCKDIKPSKELVGKNPQVIEQTAEACVSAVGI